MEVIVIKLQMLISDTFSQSESLTALNYLETKSRVRMYSCTQKLAYIDAKRLNYSCHEIAVIACDFDFGCILESVFYEYPLF